MPIYEYICDKCQTRFDLRLSIAQSNCTAICPVCYTEGRKVITSFAAKTGSYLQPPDHPFSKEKR